LPLFGALCLGFMSKSFDISLKSLSRLISLARPGNPFDRIAR
jgi:hypothetical protein